MSGRLAGKRAVVTGAAQGIGRAIVESFAREGAAVLALDRNGAGLADLPAEAHTIDLLDPAAMAAFCAAVGRVDVLVNCAGYVDAGDVLATTDEGYELSFALNVHAPARLIRGLLPAMLADGQGGSIVNLSSVAGPMIGVANRFAYCASKAAIAGLTRSIAVDYVGKGIRCNAICPGTVQSPSLDERMAATGDAEAARAAFIARQPMGRLGTAAEIAALALYLAGDESAYTTGTLVAIDGGWTMA